MLISIILRINSLCKANFIFQKKIAKLTSFFPIQIHGIVYLFDFLRNPRILNYNNIYFQMKETILYNFTPLIFNKNIFINIYTHIYEWSEVYLTLNLSMPIVKYVITRRSWLRKSVLRKLLEYIIKQKKLTLWTKNQ